jgi:hypothetical protein
MRARSSRAPSPRVEVEPAAADLRAALEVDKPQRFRQFPVRLGFERHRVGLPAAPYLDILARVFAHRRRGVGDVRQQQQFRLAFRFQRAPRVFQLLNLCFEGAQLFQQRRGILARLFAQGDLFGDSVLLGGEGLYLGGRLAPPLVDCQPLVEEVGRVAAFVQRVAHRVGFTA